MVDTWIYMKNFLRDKKVASITPTSKVGVRKVCSKINFDRSNVIVEYGPGTGVFTDYLLKNMGDESRLILIERNKHFGSYLRKTFNDPRVILFDDSAENVLETLRQCQESQADYVISGIPFMMLKDDMKDRILYNTHRALKKGGKFLAYQTCFQKDKDLKVHLEHFFPTVNSRYEIRNLPPLRIYEAVK
jgi:phospholipid N-methyltransferase